MIESDGFADGDIDFRETFEYDSRNRLVGKATDWDLDGKRVDRVTYFYDDAGNLLHKDTLKPDNHRSRVTYTYDCWQDAE